MTSKEFSSQISQRLKVEHDVDKRPIFNSYCWTKI